MKEQKINIEKPVPIGTVVEWMSDTIPSNWLVLDGKAISRNDYAELFELLGTKYGEGDGTTFNLPDVRDHVPVGKSSTDNKLNELGKKYGEKQHTLTEKEMPRHRHTLDAAGDTQWAVGSFSLKSSITNVGFSNYTGEDQPHNNMQPSIVVNFIIKAKEDILEVVIPEPVPFEPTTLYATKIDEQIIHNEYQTLIFNDNIINEKLKLQNNKILVNYDAKALIINTSITALYSTLTVMNIKLIRERDGIKQEIKQFTKVAVTDMDKSFIIDVQKNDLISIEMSCCNEIYINTDKQTYLDVIAI